jgi:putative Ca2+/H+ antiporter (TMEM165/GDT1 family)
VNLIVAATVFILVLPAELPDKTALASLVLGTQYRPARVFAGTAAAFAVHVVLAVAAGSLLGLLPRQWLDLIVGTIFLVSAALLLLFRGRAEPSGEADQPGPPEGSFMQVAGLSFGVIIIAEFGDITQLIIANLAAKYDDPAAVALGAVLALWAAAAAAIIGGRSLLRVLPLALVTRAAAVVMAGLGVINLVAAVPA